MVGLAQSRNRLDNRRGKDDKMFRRVWKAVEANTGKIGVAEIEGEKSRKEMRKEKEKEKAKKKTVEIKKITEE